MPNNIIDSFVKKSGKSKKQVEKLWNDTEKLVKKEYPDKKGDSVYKLIVGILKKRLKIVDEDAVITMGSLGPSAEYRTKVLDTVARYGAFKNMDDWGKTTSDVKPKRKKKNESVEKYINKILDEMNFDEAASDDSPEMKALISDYQKAAKDYIVYLANQRRKAAGTRIFAGPEKRKQIAVAKIAQQKAKEYQNKKNLTADKILRDES